MASNTGIMRTICNALQLIPMLKLQGGSGGSKYNKSIKYSVYKGYIVYGGIKYIENKDFPSLSPPYTSSYSPCGGTCAYQASATKGGERNARKDMPAADPLDRRDGLLYPGRLRRPVYRLQLRQLIKKSLTALQHRKGPKKKYDLTIIRQMEELCNDNSRI